MLFHAINLYSQTLNNPYRVSSRQVADKTNYLAAGATQGNCFLSNKLQANG